MPTQKKKIVNLVKLDFVALDITGKNYLTWVVDTKIHLKVGNLRETIREENNAFSQTRAKATIFIRRHLDEGLKSKYLTVEYLLAIWKKLKNIYNHQKTMILPRAHYEWTHLRIQDFKSMVEYNSVMFRISSQMKLCGETITEEDMLEKTFNTFHLIFVLLVAEQNIELLMKNHQSRPTGSAPFPEVNVVSLKVNATSFSGNNHKRGRGHKRGRWNGKDKNHGVQFHNQVPRHNSGSSFKNARPMDIPDPMFDLSGQLNTTHLNASDFIVERRNEVYRSD
ncbi:unnamed protein product [Malus baccata var. baccata]